jgi:hypothetical protein
MIKIKYEVQGKVKGRYVRKSHTENLYHWCIQSAEKPYYDLSQGTCDAEDLPLDIREKCDNYKGAFYACDWLLIESTKNE